MALVVTSATPPVLDADGAVPILITGEFDALQNPLQAYIGPNGNNTDTPCTSGVAGQGNTLFALNDTTLRCYSPVLKTGLAHYHLTVVSPSTFETVLLMNAFGVRKQFFYTEVFAVRSVLPLNYALGARSLARVPYP